MNDMTDCRCVKKDLIKGILDQKEIDEWDEMKNMCQECVRSP